MYPWTQMPLQVAIGKKISDLKSEDASVICL